MTNRPDFALHAHATLPGLVFSAMRRVMLHEAQEHDLPVIEDTDARISLQTPYGLYSFDAKPDAITATVSAAKPDWLYMLKEGLVENLTHIAPATAAAIRWSDAEQTGAQPPNFHFATVQCVTPVGAAFLRVRLKVQDLSSFQDAAIHFRLVLPPDVPGAIEWPVVSENGSTIWPKGDKALHRPVYTTRWVDHAKGLMDFDVFLHAGGRTNEWARSVSPGTRIGLTGPGGGGIPDTHRILMFGDETAFPAAARILDSLPDDATGHATFLAPVGEHCAYPMPAPTGVSVTWVTPQDGQSLSDLALTALEGGKQHFLWFAGEKTDAQRVRAAYKAKECDPANAYIAAYWGKP